MVAGIALPRAGLAYCVYNQTSDVIDATVPGSCSGTLCGDFDVSIAPGASECCNWADSGCNNTGQRDHVWNVHIQSQSDWGLYSSTIINSSSGEDASLYCVVPMRADGYAVIREWDRSHLGVGQKALFCEGWDDFNPDQLRFRTPPGIYDRERDIRFLVTGDPQFGHNATLDAEAFKVMRFMRDRIREHHYEAPGYPSDRIRGALVAGDLTQDAKLPDWEDYLDSFNGYTRFLYDGIGNHDIFDGGIDHAAACVVDHPDCVVTDEIYNTILNRRHGSVLTSRGHFLGFENLLSFNFTSPHYSWDWHDVHFIQLNLMPADDNYTSSSAQPGFIGRPYQALTFLEQDLAINIGSSGRPVVLIHHYGFDSESTGVGKVGWPQSMRDAYCDVLAPYNVLAMFTGHVHYNSNRTLEQSMEFACPAGIPDFIAAAARGNSNDSPPHNGTFLDVRITKNQMLVNKLDNAGVVKSSKTIDASPAEIGFQGSLSTSLTLPDFVNPNTGADGFKTFILEHRGDDLLGGTPLEIDGIADAGAPWLSVAANGTAPGEDFMIPVGGNRIVHVQVRYWMAPPGFSNRILPITSNADDVLQLTVNVDNTVTCPLPAEVILSTPADGETTFDDTPTFSWQAAANASAYRLQLVDDDSGVTALGPLFENSLSYTPSAPLPAGRYTWWLEGHNSAGGCDTLGQPSTRQLTIGQPQLHVDIQGSGSVSSDPAGIDCGNSCISAFALGTPVELQAVPSPGSESVGASNFIGWDGDPDCSDGSVTMNGTIFCTARFEQAEYILTVTKSGSGSGTVESDPPGIDCGSDCTEAYPAGSDPLVQLRAQPDQGSIFAFWVGCSDGSTTVLSDRSCQAVFRDANEEARLTVNVKLGGFRTLSPGTATVVSSVPGIDCEPDCAENYKVGTVVKLEPMPGPGMVFRDWSNGDPDCRTGVVGIGRNILCQANFNPTLLLVDDDDNGPNVLSSYTDALDVLGVPYDVWDTEQGDKEPETLVLADYDRVIWFSGNANEFAGPGSSGEAHLATWLRTGGCLLLSSQDYHTYGGLTPFMSEYLSVASAIDEVDHTQVSGGSGSIFDGLGPYALSYGFDNHSDAISPAAGATLAFGGDQGDAGVQVDNGLFRSVYLGFPLKALPNATDREAALGAFLEFCAKPRTPTAPLIFIDSFEAAANP